jgi:HPt (histidine-containing phosphotransfer) domain-containing protein
MELAERIAHTLKGTAANLEAIRLSEESRNLERAVKNSILDTARSHYANLQSEYTKLSIALNGCLSNDA